MPIHTRKERAKNTAAKIKGNSRPKGKFTNTRSFKSNRKK